MGRRADHKKLARHFKTGDVVTWGLNIWAHRVKSVEKTGLYVDAESVGVGDNYWVSFKTPGLKKTKMTPDVRHKVK